jgi:DNA-binding Lrp family transcriptional regulator
MTCKDIDALDRAILRALLRNGRLSHVEMAEEVPLSPTAIARRMRALEDAGVIDGYAVRIGHQALGFEIRAFVHVRLQNQSEALLSAFEAAVVQSAAIVSCDLMSGEDDYLLTVLARDLADYELLHKTMLSRLPGVARLQSSFAMRNVITRSPELLLQS